jgi:glycosyltransferase involved in cell wall biosynthesis
MKRIPLSALHRRLRPVAGRLRRRLTQRVGKAGRAPDATLEPTTLGPELDEAVLNAKRQLRVGADSDYDLVYENFDVMHYLLQTPRLIEQPRLDLIKHFLRNGVESMRSPDIHFSMSEYLERHPERARGRERSPYLEWLKHGRAAGEIADPAPAIREMARLLGLAPAQVVDLLVARRSDLVERLMTGELGEMIARASELEPLITRTRVRYTRPRLLPFGHPPALQQISAIHAAHEAAGFRPARVILVINRPRWGGGRRLEGHLAHAVVPRISPEDVVVVYTDGTGVTAEGRFPDGVREIDFAALASRLDPEDAAAALVVLLRTFGADAIVNINSATLYRAMQSLGPALAASERVFLCFFCNERTPEGGATGWSLRYFYRLFELVAGVITDSEFLAQELRETHRVPDSHLDRIHVMRAPVDPSLPFVAEAPAGPNRRPQVFWAGRWDRQKRPDLLLEVARQMPDVDFRIWGESVMDSRYRQVPRNVILIGTYGHISEIPLAEADVWLYTSSWDGVPSQLLEVAMTGIPIVGTLVGGTREVLSEADAWPVDENAEAEAYVDAIRAVLADPAESRRRARALRDRMLGERTQQAFAGQAAELLLNPDRSAVGAG